MMIALTRIGRSILARTTATGIASARTTKKSVSATRHLTSNQKNHPSILHLQRTTHNQPFAHSSSLLSTNNFSTAVVTDDKAEFIRRIKSDLAEADIKKDGRIDSDELKLILKKYSDAFTDEEVNQLCDLFYIGKGGGSVSHESFLKAVVNGRDEESVGLDHRRTIKDKIHPLGLGNCGAEFVGTKSRVYTDDELDIKLTHVEPVTFTDKLAWAAVRVVRFYLILYPCGSSVRFPRPKCFEG